MNRNPETSSSAELAIFDCEAEYPPFKPLPKDTTPTVPPETVKLVASLASQNLPVDQKSLIRMMVDGKTSSEMAKELNLSFPKLYYLWRDAYRNTKNAIDTLPEIDPNVRHWTLVEISRIAGRS